MGMSTVLIIGIIVVVVLVLIAGGILIFVCCKKYVKKLALGEKTKMRQLRVKIVKH